MAPGAKGGKRRRRAGSRKPATVKAAAAKEEEEEEEGPKPPLDPAAEVRRAAAAVVCQHAVRGWLKARRVTEQARREAVEREREEEMAKAQHDAWVEMVKRERDEEHRRMVKLAEEKRKAREKAKREAALREAAFDGDLPEVKRLLQFDDVDVDCRDANGETALLEASGGGHPAIVDLLVQSGADVNARGRYDRTPLFRAAFAGKTAAVKALLAVGCDPRLHDVDGARPVDVSATDNCIATFEGWNLAETDRLLTIIEGRLAAQRAREEAERKRKLESLDARFRHLQKNHRARQQELKQAYAEYEKRVSEYDLCTHGPEKQMVLKVVRDAVLRSVQSSEREVAAKKAAAAEAAREYQEIRLEMREHEHNEREDAADAMLHMRCNLRELDDVVMRDVGGHIMRDGRWPLLLDLSKQVSTFFRYRDCNYVNTANPKDTRKDVLRLALLGALRFGKPLVVDMLDVDLFETICDKFEAIEPGLAAAVVSKEIVQPHWYERLIKDKDGEAYKPVYFTLDRLEKFAVYFVTTFQYPDEELLEICLPIEVIPQPLADP